MFRSELLTHEFSMFPSYSRNAYKEIINASIAYERYQATEGDIDKEKLSKLKAGIKKCINHFKSMHPNLTSQLYMALQLANQVIKNKEAQIDIFNKSMLQVRNLTSNFILADEFYESCIQESSILSIKKHMQDGFIPSAIEDMNEEYYEHMLRISYAVKRFYSSRNYAMSRVQLTYMSIMGMSNIESREAALNLYEASIHFIEASKSLGNPFIYMGNQSCIMIS